MAAALHGFEPLAIFSFRFESACIHRPAWFGPGLVPLRGSHLRWEISEDGSKKKQWVLRDCERGSSKSSAERWH